jgi:succinyl-CoA synthetase beta subunit
MTLDRGAPTHVVMASQAGGMDIEEVAERTPEKILREWTHPALGLADFQARRLAFGLGLSGESLQAGRALIRNLFRSTWPRTARWPRSIRWSSRRTAACSRSTPS